MGLLDTAINFSAELDVTSSPVLKLADTSSPALPVGWAGAFVVTGPGGVIHNGTLLAPDVNGASPNFNVPIVPGGDGYPPRGVYNITYTLSAPGETNAVLVRDFTFVHEPIIPDIEKVIDVYTPDVKVVDNTYLPVSGYDFSTVSRLWESDLPTIGQISSTANFIALKYFGQYYSGIHGVEFSHTVRYTNLTRPWLTVLVDYSYMTNVDVPVRPTFPQLLAMLEDLRVATLNVKGCGTCKEDYLYAESILSHASMAIRNDDTSTIENLVGIFLSICEQYDISDGLSYSVGIISGTWTSGDDNEGAGGGVTITEGTAGSDFNIAQSGNNFTANLPAASASSTGKLTSSDWSVFSNKISDVTSAGTGNASVFKQIETGRVAQLRRLRAVSGLTIVENGDYIDFTVTVSGAGSGDVTGGSNVGGGSELYKLKSGASLVFRTLKTDGKIGIVQNADDVTLSDASHVSNSGTGNDVYTGYSAGAHRYRKILAGGSASVSVNGDGNLVISFTPPDGSETKIVAGAGVSVTGNGTVGNPYVVTNIAGGGGVPADTVKPFVVNAYLVSPTVVRVVISELSQMTGFDGCSIASPTNNPIVSVTGSGSSMFDFTVTNPIEYGADVYFSYNQALGDMRDLASTPNLMDSVTNFRVSNTIPLPGLDSIPGVQITSPTVGDVLAFDGVNFSNQPAASGGSGSQEQDL